MNEETNKYEYSPESEIEFNKAYDALIAEQIEITGVRKIQAFELGNTMISANDLIHLNWLITI